MREGDTLRIEIDTVRLSGRIDLIGHDGQRYDPAHGAAVLAARPPHPVGHQLGAVVDAVLVAHPANPRCAHCRAQWYIAMAAAAPAFSDRVEPYWVIATT